MANFSESLTIRILGDSSHLQRELDAVRRRIDELGRQFSRFDELNARLEATALRVDALSRPLLGVSRLFDRVAEQARALGEIPITLNVAPAIAALNMLLAMINLVAARLAALSFGGMLGGFGGMAMPGVRAIPRLAEGGLVNGRSGRDRVPALLSAGEFVLRESVVAKLGTQFLDALNKGFDPSGMGVAAGGPAALPSISGAMSGAAARVAGAIPRFAEGGPVAGRAVRDRVPALLSAGEFVRREPVVAKLGAPFLNAINDGRAAGRGEALAAAADPASPTSTNVNNFGGIAIHVSRPAEVNAIVRDLRLAGIRLRNRRG